MDKRPLLKSSESDDSTGAEDYKQTRVIWKAHTNPQSFQKEGSTIYFKQLTRIIRDHDVQKLKEAVTEENVELSDATGWTVLHVAAVIDDQEVLTELLRHKRCQQLLNRRDQSGVSPLMAALNSNSLNALQLLCSQGADLSVTVAKTGETLLHLASRRNSPQAAAVLLQYNSSKDFVNCMNAVGDTALIDSVRERSLVFEILLEAGADIAIQNPDNGRTVLHVAVAYNRQSMLKRCVQHPNATMGFVEVEDVQGETALMIAVKLRKLESVKILTTTFNNLNGINKREHESVLHNAVYLDRPDILKQLLFSISSTTIHYQDSKHRTPLLLAAELGHEKCVQELIESGADYFEKNPETGETIMHVVAKHHSNTTLPFLLSLSHISLFFIQKDYKGNTPHKFAITTSNDQFLRETFKFKKVDLCEYNSDGETPIYYAAKQGCPNVMKTLLLSTKYYMYAREKENSIDINDPKEILNAEIRGDIFASDVYVLLKKVVEHPLVPYFPPTLLMKTKLNRNVFHACALGGNLECLEFLYELYKVFAPKYFMDEFDSQCLNGNTPLLLAARCGPASAKCVNFFVIHGANLSASNTSGVNVIQAIYSHNPSALNLFKGLFDNCVTAKEKHYFSDRLNIKADFSIFCPYKDFQTTVVSLLFRENKSIGDKRKILEHPVIVTFLKQKLKNVKILFYIWFLSICFGTVVISITIPSLYIVVDNPVEKYGLFLFTVLYLAFLIVIAFGAFYCVFKIPSIMRNDLWATDIVVFVAPISMMFLVALGNSFYFTPELSALAIISCWLMLLLFSVNMYSTYSYQAAVYFKLLGGLSKHLLVLVVIIFAFSLSFFCLYHSKLRFSLFPVSVIYTFIVMLPGLLSDTPTFSKAHFTGSAKSQFHFVVECVVMIAFIVIAITGFLNMLVGLAVRGGKYLEADGKIFKNSHETHYLSNVEYWFRSKPYFWLVKTRWFKWLRTWKIKSQIPTTIDIYNKENKTICNDLIVRQCRSIVYKKLKSEKRPENGSKSGSFEDDFDEPFGHLPGASKDHKVTNISLKLSGVQMKRFLKRTPTLTSQQSLTTKS